MLERNEKAHCCEACAYWRQNNFMKDTVNYCHVSYCCKPVTANSSHNYLLRTPPGKAMRGSLRRLCTVEIYKQNETPSPRYPCHPPPRCGAKKKETHLSYTVPRHRDADREMRIAFTREATHLYSEAHELERTAADSLLGRRALLLQSRAPRSACWSHNLHCEKNCTKKFAHNLLRYVPKNYPEPRQDGSENSTIVVSNSIAHGIVRRRS